MIPRTAQSGVQALEWIQQGENFDLALLDMQMPEMDGLMLAERIRKIPGSANLPLLLLTSMGVRPDNPAFTGVRFSGCLTKPIKPAQLHEALTRVVSGAKPVVKKVPPAKLDPTLANRMPLRVLLCDDNLINQKVALRLLQQMGYKSDVANNGIEGLQAIERQPYDLIFMDVQMPGMDGLEATRQIREKQKDTGAPGHANFKSVAAIVAMTANAMQGDREKCLAAGMDDYLSKPVRPEDVRQIIERWGPRAQVVAAANDGLAASHTPLAGESPASGSLPAPTRPLPPPVDMERLLDFANGDHDNLRELVELYLQQTAKQVTQLSVAVGNRNPDEVKRLAHSCAGASSTCGMINISPMLRELERQGHEGLELNAAQLVQDVSREFDRIQKFLLDYLKTLAPAPQLAGN
jgi:CheY-like chemotaxis protein/HPt (histidine-containing phosphotransfer) domain-containing protein